MRFALLFFAAFVAFFEGHGQKVVDLKKEADAFFSNGRYPEALAAYQQYQSEKPGDLVVLQNLGICHFEGANGQKALEYLGYVREKSGKKPPLPTLLYWAKTLHGLEEYEKAAAAYKDFLRVAPTKDPLRAHVSDQIKRCFAGLNAQKNTEVALVENIGETINTPYPEFLPLPSINREGRLYFSTARPECIGGPRNASGVTDSLSGWFCGDMFFADSDQGGWYEPEPFGDFLNTSRFETALGFNETGKVLYFSRGFSAFSGRFLTDTSGVDDENRLNNPEISWPFRLEAGDRDPFFFKDTIVIFSAQTPGGMGGYDLYYSIYDRGSGTWGAAVNFDPSINTAYDEVSPFLAPDGRSLYFSSNRLESVGGLDVFFAKFSDKDRRWGAVSSLQSPVNSPGDDLHFRLTKTGDRAYFTSNRLGGFGMQDLYVAYFFTEKTAEIRASKPEFFSVAASLPELVAASSGDQTQAQKVTLELLHYADDKDLMSAKNLQMYRQIAELGRSAPDSKIVLTVHAEPSGAAKFDLYYGIKRAESIGNTLVRAGLPASSVVLRSAGAGFPIAYEVLDGRENPMAKQLNRRVEFSLRSLNPAPIQTETNKTHIPAAMRLPATVNSDLKLTEKTHGLHFRAHFAQTRQLFNSEQLGMYPDLMVESTPGTGEYHYSAGIFSNYTEAAKFAEELKSEGFAEATVRAYLHDIYLTKPAARDFQKKFPALRSYISAP